MISFVVLRKAPWHRYKVVLVTDEESIVVARLWSWDKADDLAELLKRVVTIAVEEARR